MVANAANHLDPRQMALLQHFRAMIETRYSESASGGMERPIVLLLEARDAIGNAIISRFFPGHPQIAPLLAEAKTPDAGVYMCTAVSTQDAFVVLVPHDPVAVHGAAEGLPGHFPVFISSFGAHALCFLPIPEADRQRSRQIEEHLAWLLQSRHTQCEILDRLMAQEAGRSHPMAAVLASVVQRSFSHIDGFVAMVRRRNLYCAIPLLRLQVDTMLRLSAFDLVDDPSELQTSLLEDRPFGKTRSRDGNLLGDSHLCEQLSPRYPWIAQTYKDACGYVHFSGSHLFGAIRAREVVPKGDMLHISSLLFEIRDPGPPWGDGGVLQALEAFKAATEGLMDLCRRWCSNETQPSP